MNLLDFKYDEGAIVYLATDPDQLPRMVTAYQIRGGVITYELSLGSCSPVWCADIEISTSKNVLASIM